MKKKNTLGIIEPRVNTNLTTSERTSRDRRISNRIIQIGTRVTPEFKRLLDRICYEEDLHLVELLEWAITELETNRVKRKQR